ncbi:MAG: septal ring lytic transglycosylase RlpA family protein [Rhizobacter sp.]
MVAGTRVPHVALRRLASATTLAIVAAATSAAPGLASPAAARGAEASPSAAAHVEREAPTAKPRQDRSGRKQVGTASVYARRLAGRKMADGTRLDANDHVAASKTLPLGTEAKITNLETGRSTRVTIQDRGPYVKGRIVDLSPAAAADVGITHKEGIAKVEVAPITVPGEKGGAKD